MLDRIRLAYVVDFFYFKLIDFPIFNVADIYVSVATVVLAFCWFCSTTKMRTWHHILKNRKEKESNVHEPDSSCRPMKTWMDERIG